MGNPGNVLLTIRNPPKYFYQWRSYTLFEILSRHQNLCIKFISNFIKSFRKEPTTAGSWISFLFVNIKLLYVPLFTKLESFKKIEMHQKLGDSILIFPLNSISFIQILMETYICRFAGFSLFDLELKEGHSTLCKVLDMQD